MSDPVLILEPNYLGNHLDNSGLEDYLSNHGLGVSEINNLNVKQKKSTKSAAVRDRLRIAKAREFGMTKEEVGF